MNKKPIRRDPDDGRIYVNDEEVPEFATDEEEGEFWRTHTFSPESWEGATRVPDAGSVRERLVRERQRPQQQAS
jgi:hypothetical protein